MTEKKTPINPPQNPPVKLNKDGRPSKKRGTKVKPIDYELVRTLASRGMDKGHIASCIGMNRSTLYRKQGEDPKFLAAIEDGTAEGIRLVTAQLLKNIALGNVTAQIFYLKCRAKWRETSVVLTGELPAIPDANCSAEDAELAYIAHMRDKPSA